MNTNTIIAALLLTLTSACGSAQPAQIIVEETVEHCAFSSKQVWEARDMLEQSTGLEARNFDVECVQGWALIEGRVGNTNIETRHITIKNRLTLGQTALFHEMLHIALFDATGDGDAHHTGELWQVLPELKSEFGGCDPKAFEADLDC